MMSLMGVNETKLSQCVENVRSWISNTILSRIVDEIDNVNGALLKMGFVDGIGGGLTLTFMYKSSFECCSRGWIVIAETIETTEVRRSPVVGTLVTVFRIEPESRISGWSN